MAIRLARVYNRWRTGDLLSLTDRRPYRRFLSLRRSSLCGADALLLGGRGRCQLNERDVTTLWRNLFTEQGTTTASLAKAQALLDSMNPESPLRLRLALELQDIRKLRQKK